MGIYQDSVRHGYCYQLISGILESAVGDLIKIKSDADTTASSHMYTSSICPEEDLFTLRYKIGTDTLDYYNLSRSGTTEEQMDRILVQIVEGLFDNLATMGYAPSIRCPKGNSVEQVAERLYNKIKSNISDTSNTLFNRDVGSLASFSQERPLLVILDRDLATCLHHTWTYQALIADVFDNKSGLVVVKEKDENSCKEKKITWELNNDDKFWMDQKGSVIPFVAEALHQEIDSYRSDTEKVRRLKETMTEDEVDLTCTNRQITSAVPSLPQLDEKYKRIEMHTSLTQAILDQVKIRPLIKRRKSRNVNQEIYNYLYLLRIQTENEETTSKTEYTPTTDMEEAFPTAIPAATDPQPMELDASISEITTKTIPNLLIPNNNDEILITCLYYYVTFMCHFACYNSAVICYNSVYIITLPLCVILRVENVILPRNYCYRNLHALKLTNDVLWSKIKKRVTPTVMIYQPLKNAQNIKHLIRPNSYQPR
ncbi:protein sly1 homolog [Artemia franciscana]|uniref:protein sly1 homolog n=1 Tax=Artemia franciscana TaxID=6661 RepID=UPI0032D9F170